MAFFDKVKEVGVKGMDKAKDLGEQAKLGVQKEKLAVKVKDTYTELGKNLAENYPELLAEKFPEAAQALADAKAEIEKLEEQIAALKAQ